MITADKLRESSMAKRLLANGMFTSVVLTNEELRLTNPRSIMEFRNDEVFFFTDDYCCLVSIEDKKGLCGCITGIPLQVTPRESLPSGYITNVDEYIKIFCKDKHQITSIQELVDYLNKS